MIGTLCFLLFVFVWYHFQRRAGSKKAPKEWIRIMCSSFSLLHVRRYGFTFLWLKCIKTTMTHSYLDMSDCCAFCRSKVPYQRCIDNLGSATTPKQSIGRSDTCVTHTLLLLMMWPYSRFSNHSCERGRRKKHALRANFIPKLRYLFPSSSLLDDFPLPSSFFRDASFHHPRSDPFVSGRHCYSFTSDLLVGLR